jgi:hypothetical protein
LVELSKEMFAVSGKVYSLFFRTNMGGKVHAFIEFCGVLDKYVGICSRAAAQGIDFTNSNVHTGVPLPVEVHDMEYLGEKLACIFGPMLASNPEARDALKTALFGAEARVAPARDAQRSSNP